MMRPLLAIVVLVAGCTAHAPPPRPAPEDKLLGLPEGPACGGRPDLPDKATLVVHLREPDGAAPAHAGVRVDPCCGSCEHSTTDVDGRAVLEACPDARSHDVIVSVETNPRWYTFTPPRAVRICERISEITIEVAPHPRAPR